ncbi:MAG: tetratricopeptide repeat protein [Elusimicrobiota bacterium]|nr:tetratricopeptide repeat protein [Elusimicrobiota bacterium]
MNEKKIVRLSLIFLFYTIQGITYGTDIGILSFIQKDYKTAELTFKQEYLNTQDRNVLFYLANTYYINKKYELASSCYLAFLEDNDNTDEYLKNFAKFMLADTLILLSQYEKALDLLNSLDISFLNEKIIPHFYYNKAFCSFKLGEYNSAINNISLFKANTSGKNLNNEYDELLAQVDFILSECWYAKGNYKMAVEHYNKFIANYNQHELAIYANLRLSNILEEQKKYEHAAQILSQIGNKKYDLHPEIEFIVKYNTARLLAKQRKFVYAARLYEQLLEGQHDKNANMYIKLELAYCYFCLKKYENVLRLLSNLPVDLDLNLKHNIIYLTGITLYNVGDYHEAIKVFTKFKEEVQSKWYDDGLYWLAMCYYKQKQFKRSIEIFSLLKNKKGSSYYISANIYLARCYKQLKEYDLAELILNKLLQQNLNEGMIRIVKYELAECHKLQGEYEIAKQYYEHVISTVDTTADSIVVAAKLAIADMYMLTGKFDEAENLIKELYSNYSIPSELQLKCKMLYVLNKYNKGEFEIVEREISEILKLENLPEENKRNLLAILYNTAIMKQDVRKALEVLNKLLVLEKDETKKFNLQLKTLRIAFSQKYYDITIKKINELQKFYKKPSYMCILNYFQTKYFHSINDENSLIAVLEKFKNFSYDAFRFFNKNEIQDVIKLSCKYKIDVAYYLAEQVIPYVSNEIVEDTIKKELIVTVIDELYNKSLYTSAMKLLSLLKKSFNDNDTYAYIEFKTAQIYEVTGRMNFAENIYKNILTTYPKTPYAVMSCLALISYYSKQNNAAAMDFYEKKLVSDFTDSELTHKYFYEKAIDMYKNQQYEEVINKLTPILGSKNKNIAANAQKLLADCYYELSRYKEATIEYLRIIYLFPEEHQLCAEAQYKVGLCAEKLKLYDEAKKAYINSKTKYPGTLWAQEAELKLKQIR